jgi:anti-sigma factor RsiW
VGRELNHGEVRDLLGAYALDAVDDNERRAVDRHLEDCPPCQAEVAEHREVVGMLASGFVPAPEGLWDRIAGSLEEVPPPMRGLAPVAFLERERERRRLAPGPVRAIVAVGVAASVGVVGLLGVKVLDTSNKVNDVAAALHGEDVRGAALAAASRPDARKVALRSPDGRLTAQAVLLADGTGYLVDANLPALSPERTYQLWAVGRSTVSVGVLGPVPGPTAFRAAGDVRALAITEETAGGVVSSQQQPRVAGTVA